MCRVMSSGSSDSAVYMGSMPRATKVFIIIIDA